MTDSCSLFMFEGRDLICNDHIFNVAFNKSFYWILHSTVRAKLSRPHVLTLVEIGMSLLLLILTSLAPFVSFIVAFSEHQTISHVIFSKSTHSHKMR